RRHVRTQIAKGNRQKRNKKRRHVLNARRRYAEKRLQFVKAFLRRIVWPETYCSLQFGDERIECAVGVVRRTLVMQERVRLVGDAHFESRDKTGLANPRLA